VIAAGIARVVACHADPDARTGGQGFARLRAAGVAVEMGTLAAEAVRLNFAYLIARTQGRPAVTLKWAMSLDGKIATASGKSQWISSPAARRWALGLREEHDAVLVGSGTVLADDPLLNRRLGLAGKDNLRVVLDRRLRTPPKARLFTASGEVLMYAQDPGQAAKKALEQAGAAVVALPAVEPRTVLADLFRRGVQSVLVEGGSEILATFVASGLYDRVLVDCAPLLIGGRGAPGPVGGAGAAELAAAARLDTVKVGRRGSDVILSGARSGCLPALLSSVGAS
jgi:diaminohydroxyphosphoribosylaminopyrimidine deaminase/5-amino-6-(5-phosphoribosylamino)uracil reductase